LIFNPVLSQKKACLKSVLSTLFLSGYAINPLNSVLQQEQIYKAKIEN